MAVEKSYTGLGIFLVATLTVAVGTGMFFFHRMQKREVIEMVTYTAGNVSGLDVGSPVRFRGVPIGSVDQLRIDPRGSLIEVDFAVYLEHLADIGSNSERIKAQAASGSFPNMRVQVIRHPVTGESYLFLDMPANPPAPIELPFRPARVYVPFMPTALGTLEDRLPQLIDQVTSTLQALADVVSKLPAATDRSDRFLARVEQIVREAHLPETSADARRSMAGMASEMERISSTLDKSLGPGGTLEKLADDTRAALVAAEPAATNQAIREAMNQTSLSSEDLRRSLPAMRDALTQLRDLARLLEAQPEAVIYGIQPSKVKK